MQTDAVRRRPRVVSLLVGIVATVLGLALLAQPFTSVALLTLLLAAAAVVTGVGRILAPELTRMEPSVSVSGPSGWRWVSRSWSGRACRCAAWRSSSGSGS
jgi:hypothetical protein